MRFFATCKFGLEGLLSRELRDMGVQDVEARDARVYFSGGLDALCRANIWCRTADRVFLEIAAFKAKTFDELYEGTKAVAWEDYVGKQDRFPVKGKTAHSLLHSVSDCQAIVKKAVADRLMRKYKTSWMTETAGTYTIEVGLLNDVATLALDASGEGLSRRGYRIRNAEAPLRETLAAALVLLTKRGSSPLVDPMCGSGTIAIEAAMLAKNQAPGLNRNFAAEGWSFVPAQLWRQAKEQAVAAITPAARPVLAGDIDGVMVEMAQFHADRAGVQIEFCERDVRNFTPKPGGVVVCNPPYGERLLDVSDAERLYRDLGDVYRKSGMEWCVLSPHPKFERFFGGQADKRRKLYNGRLVCQCYQYFIKSGAARPRTT